MAVSRTVFECVVSDVMLFITTARGVWADCVWSTTSAMYSLTMRLGVHV